MKRKRVYIGDIIKKKIAERGMSISELGSLEKIVFDSHNMWMEVLE